MPLKKIFTEEQVGFVVGYKAAFVNLLELL